MRSLLPFLIIALVMPALAAQDENCEVPLPYVTLVQPPSLPKITTAALPQKRVNEIKRIIDDLAGLRSLDVGMLGTAVFLPVGVNAIGERTEHKVQTYAPIQKLVEIGPDALPFLLDALDDDTPTELVIKAVTTDNFISRGMAFDEILHGNPVNPTERFILNLDRRPYTDSIRPKDPFGVANELECYRVKVGDVCFVIIGQIVGRDYQCLFNPDVKSLDVIVCSPVHRQSIRDNVRRIWQSKNTHQKVLESLLLDYSTRGLLQMDSGQWQMDSLHYWDIGSDFQIQSVMRLLYYYPDETATLISARLMSLDVSDDSFAVCVKNGVCAGLFVDAVSWSTNRHIRSALGTLAEEAKDRDVIRSLERAGIDRDRTKP